MINAILNRRSYRSYKPQAVSDQQLSEILKAAQYAPTAMNRRAIEFVVITNPQVKEEIFEILDQEYIKTAPILIIPVATQQAALPIQDLTLATAHIFLQAAEMGLGTVWKNLTPEWAEKLKAVLQIPAACHLINVIPLGFPLEQKAPHSEEEFEQIKVHTDRW